MKIQKKNIFFWGGVGGRGRGGTGEGSSGWGGQGGCERRTEVFMKIKKKIYIYIFFVLGGGGGGGGQGGCESRIAVFWKIQKKKFGGGGGSGESGWGVRMDVNEELKFL